MAAAKSARNCLHLGPTQIGSKGRDMGNDTFDHASTALKNTPEGEFLFQGISDHLEKAYPNVYDGTTQTLIQFPPEFDYGIQNKEDMNEKNQKKKLKEEKNKKGPKTTQQKSRAMQYGEEVLAEQRITELNTPKKMADLKEKKFLEDVLKDKKPLSTEEMVLKRFMKFFKDEPGIACMDLNRNNTWNVLKKWQEKLGSLGSH